MKAVQPRVLVGFWGRFIDWEKRRKGENGFLVKTLSRFKARKVFDSCMGDGCDTIFLLKEGFEVTSNDLDVTFIRKAQENARKNSVRLNVTSFDWRRLDKHFPPDSFDAVICLGNSLTYLFSKKDHAKSLRGFYRLLRKGGVLVVDERNYDYFLKNRKEILAGKFRYRGKFVYCGTEVKAHPIRISSKEVVMEYCDSKTSQKCQLVMYPFKKGELRSRIREAGFGRIETYCDFQKKKDNEADFFTYVAQK